MNRKVVLSPIENPGWPSAIALLGAIVFFGYCVGNAISAILEGAFK